jgi:DNA modification methylase
VPKAKPTAKAEYTLDPRNARRHSDPNKKAVESSLRELGAGRSIVVDREGVVIGGNAVYEQALKLGIPVREVETSGDELIVVRRVDLATDDPKRKALALADNQIATLAEWEQERLDELLAEVGDIDFGTMGFEIPKEPEAPGTAEALVDQAAALLEKWGVERGQVWEIPGKAGVHRVMCGDSRELLQGIAAASVAMVFTDPPYGHNNNDGDLISSWEAALGKGKSGPARPIANDGPEANDLFRAVLPEIKRVLVPGGCCCCCCGGGGGPDPQFARWSLWLDEVIPFKMCVVWDKGGLGMGWHYRRCWECILVAEKPGAACKWYGGNDVPNVIRDISKIIPSKDQHPTEKPIALAEWFILLHSQTGELVLDPFLGSGSTLMAAEQQGRVCVGIDVEPKYVAVTLERCQKNGMEPVKT